MQPSVGCEGAHGRMPLHGASSGRNERNLYQSSRCRGLWTLRGIGCCVCAVPSQIVYDGV